MSDSRRRMESQASPHKELPRSRHPIGANGPIFAIGPRHRRGQVFAESPMTTIGLTQHRGRMVAQPVRSGVTITQILLVCGLLSSLLYVAMNVFSAMQWEG